MNLNDDKSCVQKLREKINQECEKCGNVFGNILCRKHTNLWCKRVKAYENAQTIDIENGLVNYRDYGISMLASGRCTCDKCLFLKEQPLLVLAAASKKTAFGSVIRRLMVIEFKNKKKAKGD